MKYHRTKHDKLYRFRHSATVYFFRGDPSPLKVIKREYVDGLPMYRVRSRDGGVYYCHETEPVGRVQRMNQEQQRYRHLRSAETINDECAYGTLPVFTIVGQNHVLVKAAHILRGQLFVQCRTGAWVRASTVYQDLYGMYQRLYALCRDDSSSRHTNNRRQQ